MHYSRVSTPPEKAYSPAVAVLLTELLKGSISLVIALYRIDPARLTEYRPIGIYTSPPSGIRLWPLRIQRLTRDVFSHDCWKLSIPAILYVVQNNLQYVAASNLDVATFQVTYQMKILTTAAFSVVLLRRTLGSTKWLALLGLALGVGIVQIQAGFNKPESGASANHAGHVMNPMKGFMAVAAACFTSGLAGVYFEMMVKSSQSDLWVRNVQLALFSIIPAIFPVFFNNSSVTSTTGWFPDLFQNFGFWAWTVVAIQVFGGLVTALVIKYADNILKGFATSLSIIISFLASVMLFDFRITPGFVIGCSVVLAATWLYNQPTPKEDASRQPAAFLGEPVDSNTPIIADFPRISRHSSSLSLPRVLASSLGLGRGNESSVVAEKAEQLSAAGYPGHGPLRSTGTSAPASGLQSRDSVVELSSLR